MIFEKTNDIFTARTKMNRTHGFEKWVLLISDVHYDSKHCDRKLLKRHLDEALDKNASVYNFGDFWDMMGGKYDPRSNKADVRPEYQVPNYFDAVIEDGYEFLKPYSPILKFMSYGNHEATVIKRQEIDPLWNLTKMLNCELGGYQGFINSVFDRSDGKGAISSKLLYYTHGSGGNSPVTRGVIKTNRRAAVVEADIFVSGHIHSEWVVNIPRVKVSQRGNIIKAEQTHIALGTYKDDSFKSEGVGWADMKEFPPPSMGGCWIRFYYDSPTESVKYETIRTI